MNDKKLPKYKTIYQLLKKEIHFNEHSEMALLPTEAELMEKYNVSRTTIRRATALLREDGLIRSSRGHGTDILSNIQSINRSRGSRLNKIGSVDFTFTKSDASLATNSNLLFDIVSASDDVAKELEIAPGTNVYLIRWLHFINKIPYLYLTNYLRTDMTPDLQKHLEDAGYMIDLLYPFLKEHYGLEFSHGVEKVRPIVADFVSARLLDVPVGTPLLMLLHTAYCNEGVLEYSRSIIRTDQLEIAMNTVPIKQNTN